METAQQAQVSDFLNTHLSPFLELTKETSTVYDITVRFEMTEWVVMVRSWELIQNMEALAGKFKLDEITRKGIDRDGKPVAIENAVYVRFVSKVNEKQEMLVEYFQVYESNDDAKMALEEVEKVLSKGEEEETKKRAEEGKKE